MLELYVCIRQFMADKLKGFRRGLEEFEKLKISVASGAVRKEGLQREIKAELQWCE